MDAIRLVIFAVIVHLHLRFICHVHVYFSGSKPKSKKPKQEKTKEEKTFRRRAKFFLVAQAVAVLLFLTHISGRFEGEAEVDDDYEGYGYDE